jgi:hypothetical protein
MLPSSLSVFSKAESPRLRYPGATLVTNNPSAAQNNVSSSTPDLPHATPNSFACDLNYFDYRPKSPRRKPAARSSVSVPDANGVSHTVTDIVTFDTGSLTAESFSDGNESTSFDTFDLLDYIGSSEPEANISPVELDATRTAIGTVPVLVRENQSSAPSLPRPKELHQMSKARHQVWENRKPTPPLPDSPAPRRTSTKQLNLLWETKAYDAAKLEIFTTLTRSGDDKAPKTATLNIASTQRLVLAYQQRKISKWAANLYIQSISDIESGAVCVELRELIHEYCESPSFISSRICSLTLLLHSGDMVRDLEYMQLRAADCGEHDEDDPFYLKSSRRIDRLAMELAELIPNHVLPAGDLPIARDHDHPTLPGIPRTIAIKANKSKHLLLRFSMASAGGLSLIVPVLVMANIPGRTSSLVTTCIAMLIFAIGVTFGTDLKADQVLGATAAYAAVLVVFVGTSLANTGA